MGGAPEFIVSIAPLAVEDSVFSCGLNVLQAALEEVDGDVIFAHEAMAELVGYHDDATGSNGINEEAVRPVERINIAAPVMDFGPARRLHRAADLERAFAAVKRGTEHALHAAIHCEAGMIGINDGVPGASTGKLAFDIQPRTVMAVFNNETIPTRTWPTKDNHLVIAEFLN